MAFHAGTVMNEPAEDGSLQPSCREQQLNADAVAEEGGGSFQGGDAGTVASQITEASGL